MLFRERDQISPGLREEHEAGEIRRLPTEGSFGEEGIPRIEDRRC